MKKLMIGLVAAGAVALPSAAWAQINFGPYESKGACQSAMMELRNDFRKNPSTRPIQRETGSLSNSEFNEWGHENYACLKRSDGWYIRYIG